MTGCPEKGEWVHVPGWGDSDGFCMARVRVVYGRPLKFDAVEWEDGWQQWDDAGSPWYSGPVERLV